MSRMEPRWYLIVTKRMMARARLEYRAYGPEFARGSKDTEGFEHVIRYDNGIGVDFVLASGSVPVNYRVY